MADANPGNLQRTGTFNRFLRRDTLAATDDEAIVYDPYSHELRKDALKDIKGNSDYVEVEIPRWGKKVDVYLNIGPADAKTNRFLATVNLNSLGFTMNMKRHLGDLKCIYVLEGSGVAR